MTGLVVANRISLGLDNHAPAAVPNQLAADHLARTSHGIAFEKFRRNVHAAHNVKSRQKRSIFCLCKKLLVANRPIGGPSSRMAQISITDGEAVLPDTSLPNTARTTLLKRRCAAEEWAMPEDGPPMESGMICERRLSVTGPPVLILGIRPHSGKARLRRR